MKKIIIFLAIVLVIVCIALYNYNSIKITKSQIAEENAEYEQYLNRELYGIDLATIINKAVDQNTKNKIEKDEQGYFVQNDENSILVEIYIKESDTTYKMERIHNKGTEQFVQFFINAKFKATKVDYHKKNGRIKYMLFEQI